MASSRSLGSLTLDLIANIGGFTGPMSQAARAAQDSLNSIEKSVSDFSDNISKLLEFAGVTVGIDAVVDGIKDAIEQMDDLGKSAQKVGLPVEQFSAFAGAAKLSDVATDDLVSTLGRFSKSVATATNSQSEQAKIFNALGISITNQNGQLKSSTDLMLEFSDQFKELGVNTTTTAAGIALFGKNFQDIIPFLSQGSDGIKEAQQEAIDLGAALAGPAAAAAHSFDDDMDKIALASQGVKNQLVQALLPALNEWADQAVDLAKDHQNLENITTGLAGAMRGLELVANAIAAGFAIIQAVVETLTVTIANGIQHFTEYAQIAALAATNPAAAFAVAKASFSTNANGIKTDAATAASSITDSWVNAESKIEAAFGRMGHDINDPLTAPIKNATAGIVDLSTQVNNLASGGVKTNAAYVSMVKQISALGAAAIKSGEDVTQVQSIIAAGVSKAQQALAGSSKLAGLQAALNPAAAQQAEKIAEAMQKLGDAVAKVNESADPTAKAYNSYAQTVRTIDQLGASAIKAGANVVQVQNLVASGVEGAQKKLAEDINGPILATQNYIANLQQQLAAQDAVTASQVAAISVGTQLGQNQEALAKVTRDGTVAVAAFEKQYQDSVAKGNPSIDANQYAIRDAALKQYWADVLQHTKDGQAAVTAAQSDWQNGVTQAWENFYADQQNSAKVAGALTTNFLDDSTTALNDFVDGTKSAKDALKEFIDSFEQQITAAVDKQLLSQLFNIGGNSQTGSGSSLFGGIGDIVNLFTGGGYGTGHANGGTAGAGSISQVNERGPELLTVGGKDFLMMGGQSGRVTPNEQIRTGGGTQQNNFYLAAPTSAKTQTQIANKLAYQQRIASRLS